MLTELYSVAKGTSLQCDLTERIVVHFKNEEWRFSVIDFKVFRRKLHEVDIQKMLFNLSDDFDFVSLEHQKSKILLKLTLCDFLQLRELLDGTQFTLEMISMIHEVLGDYVVA
jgi:hypothetical protein